MERFPRRKLFTRVLPGTALLLAGCETSKPQDSRLQRDTELLKNLSLKTFNLPLLPIDSPMITETLDIVQREPLQKIGIKQITFKETQNQGTDVAIEFDDSAKKGSMFNSRETNYPARVLVWSQLPTGEIIAHLESPLGGSFETEGYSLREAEFLFSFNILKKNSYVVTLDPSLLDLGTRNTEQVVIPFRFATPIPPIPQGPQRPQA